MAQPAQPDTKPTTPAARYPIPFLGPKDCVFSLLERPRSEMERKSRDGKPTGVYIQVIGTITIPLRDANVKINADVWKERKINADGDQQLTYSFSLPNTLIHTYLHYVKGTHDYAEALAVFNSWRGELVNLFEAWHAKTVKDGDAPTGQIVRLVKRTAA